MFFLNLLNYFKKSVDGLAHIGVSVWSGDLQPLTHFILLASGPTVLTYIQTNPATILSPAFLPTLGTLVVSSVFAAATISQNKNVALAAQVGKVLYDAHVLATANKPVNSGVIIPLPTPPPAAAPTIPIVAVKS